MRKKINLLLLFCCLLAMQVQAQIINTIAGNGNTAFDGDGGPAINGSLNKPAGVSIDRFNNIYIADYENNRIRKINAEDNTITTIAGNGAALFNGDNGLAINASLDKPSAVTTDANGNIYIADTYNHRIRKIEAESGIITTIAGNGSATYNGDNIPAINSSLNGPTDVAVDNAGNIYIADRNNFRIRKINAVNNLISTIAGNGIPDSTGDGGLATAANLFNPAGICVDKYGNLFIADEGNNAIRKVESETQVITKIAGMYGMFNAGYLNGRAVDSSKLANPVAIAIDSIGDLYIADAFNNAIRKITYSTGIISTVAGLGGLINLGFTGDGGPAINAKLAIPMGVAVDANYNIYIADSYNERIRKVTSTCIPKTYTFIGDSAWSNPNNWSNGERPPSILPSCCEIIIDHILSGSCVLDIPQTLADGARIKVMPKSRLFIPENIAPPH